MLLGDYSVLKVRLKHNLPDWANIRNGSFKHFYKPHKTNVAGCAIPQMCQHEHVPLLTFVDNSFLKY